MGFRELDNIKGGYDSGFDRILQDFYIPVLNEAKVYKRIAGFFSSTSLAIAARGITGLIKNGGYMELIVSPRLSDEDIKAMEKAAQDPEEIITSVMLDEIENMETFLQKKRVDALGWLLAKGLLKIKVATVYDDKVLRSVSQNKQIILFVTEDEYSVNVRDVFEPYANRKYKFELIGEDFVKVGVM